MASRLVTAALVLVAACASEDVRPFPADAAIPEPILPTQSPSQNPALRVPAWTTTLPDEPPTLTKGTRVWATMPHSDMPDVGVFMVEGVYDGTYSLTDLMGQRTDGVHPALVHRAYAAHRLVEGTVVLFATKTTPGMIGRVSKIVPGGEINVRYDAGGVTRIAAVDHAEAPVTGVRAMAYVRFPKTGRDSVGLLVALSASDGWVRTSSGHIEMHPRVSIKELALSSEPLAVGARVDAYSWATGIRPGTVVAVPEPSVRYQVKLDDTGAAQEYFFAAVSRR